MANEVVFSRCPFFDESFAKRADSNVKAKLADFIKSKTENPMAAFGGSDTPFISAGPLGKVGIKHAHLTRDISVLYTLSGKNPHVIKLYGIVSHADSGTGTPANIKKQKNLAKTLDNQSFS